MITMNRAVDTIQRSFCIGDQWLYYKLYCGSVSGEKVMIDHLYPTIEDLLKKKLIAKWFFIRYNDSNSHIRIRFFSPNQNDILEVIAILQPIFAKLLKSELIWRVQADTYQRELERYGEHNIELSETFFFIDSAFIIELLRLFKGAELENMRWLSALKMIDILLNSFGYKLQAKLKFATYLRDAFENEFMIDKALQKEINDNYRKQRKKIENFEKTEQYKIVLPWFNKYEIELQRLSPDIMKNYAQNEAKFNHLISSYIHMSINRIFKSKNRVHELVCYSYLSKIYKSEIARARNN